MSVVPSDSFPPVATPSPTRRPIHLTTTGIEKLGGGGTGVICRAEDTESFCRIEVHKPSVKLFVQRYLGPFQIAA